MKYTVLLIRYNRPIEVVLDKKKCCFDVILICARKTVKTLTSDLGVCKNNIYFRIVIARAINSKSATHKQGHNTIDAITHLF